MTCGSKVKMLFVVGALQTYGINNSSRHTDFAHESIISRRNCFNTLESSFVFYNRLVIWEDLVRSRPSELLGEGFIHLSIGVVEGESYRLTPNSTTIIEFYFSGSDGEIQPRGLNQGKLSQGKRNICIFQGTPATVNYISIRHGRKWC